ncbi:hypothetical protein GCM10009122_18050 [Fulvivirga kasyanovii]|uniref:STAS/SEC14 domain-containing protein n=1 Tax=Fulvivirga kasyanovii TaxID=396812 RepID=A0ABW9RWZ4_9BACT|nr:hypothetical protein [Fulvivirga kasyanovii]MTI28769.1 hypothetical protein [Fulvivirga kasyanovii]
MELYFKSDYVKISYEPSWGYIKVQWLIPPTNGEFREACEQMLGAIIHYEATKALIDTNKQGAIHPELIEWMDKVWAKRAIANGYRHCAIITPTDIFASFSLAEIAQMSDKTLVVTEYFEEEKIAIDWLKKLSVPGTGGQIRDRTEVGTSGNKEQASLF